MKRFAVYNNYNFFEDPPEYSHAYHKTYIPLHMVIEYGFFNFEKGKVR